MQTKEIIKRRDVYLKSRIAELRKELAKYPDGKLHSYPNKKHYDYWISYENHERVYLPKSSPEMIRTMAYKNFLEASLYDCSTELQACERYLRFLERHPADATDKLLKNKGMQQALRKTYGIEKLDAWINEPYEKNPNHPESLTVSTITGEKVRSKSESMFLQLLYTMGIPYRYEQLLRLDGIDFYPDFTLLRPRDHKIFTAELFGMMDDERYRHHTFRKLHIYSDNGLIPDDNLLIFFETKSNPLDISLVRKQLDHFLL